MLLCARWTEVGLCGGWESVAALSLHGQSINAVYFHCIVVSEMLPSA